MRILSNLFSKIVIIVAILIATIGLNANLFKTNHASQLTNIFGWLMLLFAITLIVFAILFYRRLANWNTKKLIGLLIIIYMVMLGTQMFVTHSFTVSLVRDPFRITSTAIQLAQDSHASFNWPVYFSRAVNNINITLILSKLLVLSQWLPLSILSQVKLWQLILLQLVVIVTLLNIYVATNNLRLVILGQLWFTFSPFLYTYNLLVFYSDTWLILGFGIVLLGLQLLYKLNLNGWQTFAITSCTMLSAFLTELIKPNFIIIIPALIIWLIILIGLKQLKKPILVAIIGIISATILTFPATTVINNQVGFKVTSQYEFPIQHWIMMGLNTKNEGAYYNDDVKLTSQPKTLTAKKIQDTHIIKERLKKMGIGGYFKLIFAKLQNLQNQGKLNRSYIDGYRNAPNWFFNQPNQINILVSLFTKLSMSILFILAIIGMLTLLGDISTVGTKLLASLFYIGLLLFHALLWESNNRYGEAIIIPLIFLATVGFKKLTIFSISYKFRHLAKLATVSTIVVVSLGWLNFKPLMASANEQNSKPFYGQLSNWGGNFAYPSYQLRSKQTLKQNIYLPTTAQMLVIRTIANERGTISLRHNNKVIFKQKNTGKHHTEMNGDSGIRIIKNFKAGCYQITYQNPTNHPVKVRIQNAPYPLQKAPIDNLNGHKSFIFMFHK